jgi:hypothetical protein
LEADTVFKLISNNGLAIVLLVWVLYKAEKYISIFIPKLDQILDRLSQQTLAFIRLSEEIKKWNGDK